MLTWDNGEFIMDDEAEYEWIPSLIEEDGDSSEKLPTNDQVGLVIRRALAAHVKEDEEVQRENIYYTCMLTYQGHSASVASMLMVEN